MTTQINVVPSAFNLVNGETLSQRLESMANYLAEFRGVVWDTVASAVHVALTEQDVSYLTTTLTIAFNVSGASSRSIQTVIEQTIPSDVLKLTKDGKRFVAKKPSARKVAGLLEVETRKGETLPVWEHDMLAAIAKLDATPKAQKDKTPQTLEQRIAAMLVKELLNKGKGAAACTEVCNKALELAVKTYNDAQAKKAEQAAAKAA